MTAISKIAGKPAKIELNWARKYRFFYASVEIRRSFGSQLAKSRSKTSKSRSEDPGNHQFRDLRSRLTRAKPWISPISSSSSWSNRPFGPKSDCPLGYRLLLENLRFFAFSTRGFPGGGKPLPQTPVPEEQSLLLEKGTLPDPSLWGGDTPPPDPHPKGRGAHKSKRRLCSKNLRISPRQSREFYK